MQSVEKAFVADVCAATRDVKFDEVTLNGVRCPSLTFQTFLALSAQRRRELSFSAKLAPQEALTCTLLKWL